MCPSTFRGCKSDVKDTLLKMSLVLLHKCQVYSVFYDNYGHKMIWKLTPTQYSRQIYLSSYTMRLGVVVAEMSATLQSVSHYLREI